MNEREALNWEPIREFWRNNSGVNWDELEAVIKEALAQPEQEPVTWRNAAIRVGEDLCSVGPFGYYDMTAKQWLDWALSVVTVHAPPQRTWEKPWVSLTDEEFQLIYDMGRTPAGMMEMVEAKLKEKNT